MNYLDYLKLWIWTGERPPREVLLVSTRKPTTREAEYGKSLEVLANDYLKKDSV